MAVCEFAADFAERRHLPGIVRDAARPGKLCGIHCANLALRKVRHRTAAHFARTAVSNSSMFRSKPIGKLMPNALRVCQFNNKLYRA